MPSFSVTRSVTRLLSFAGAGCLGLALVGWAQSPAPPPSATHNWPWMNTSLTPDQRADLVIQQMTLDEKMNFVHGTGWNGLREHAEIPKGSLGGAGYVEGVARLGIPGINMADSAVGVRLSGAGSHYATLLPSVVGAASSWDPTAYLLFGDVIGRELRENGYNMSIGGGVDLAREPRNGRNFEYAGEDPLLAGTMVGNIAKGVRAEPGDGRHQALRVQRPGDGAQHLQRRTDGARGARKRPAGIPDRGPDGPSRGGDVLVQPGDHYAGEHAPTGHARTTISSTRC